MRKLIPILFVLISISATAQEYTRDQILLQKITNAREQIAKAPDGKLRIEVYSRFKSELEQLELISRKNANSGNRNYRMTLIALNDYLSEIHCEKLTLDSCAQYEAVIRDNGAVRIKLAKKEELFGEATEALSFLKLLCPLY